MLVVVVLGMGSSGTALACQALEAMGVQFGECLGPAPRNERGHYEHVAISTILQDLYADCLGFSSWATRGAMPRGVESWPAVAPYREKLTAALAEELARHREFGLKEPRITRLLPLWESVCAEVGARPRYVTALRDPHEVYASLLYHGEIVQKRSRASERWVWEMWAEFLSDARRVRSECDLWFEDWFTDETAQLRKLASALSLPMPARSVVDGSLRHAVA